VPTIRDFVKNPEKSKLELPKLKKEQRAHKKQTKKTVRTKKFRTGPVTSFFFFFVCFFEQVKNIVQYDKTFKLRVDIKNVYCSYLTYFRSEEKNRPSFKRQIQRKVLYVVSNKLCQLKKQHYV